MEAHANGQPSELKKVEDEPVGPLASLTHSRLAWLAVGALVGVFAFAVRLIPVRNGGGIRGFYNYDPAVYYAASAGLAHGMMPYRDFLLLHPPGVPLLLLPFSLLGRLTSDSIGMAAARLAFMAGGALIAVIITRILRPAGIVPALIGGAAYAVYWPAVYSERATWLEGPGSLLTALALWFLAAPPRLLRERPGWAAGLAGAALGLSCLMKIWGVAPLAAVLLWLALRRQWRSTLLATAGAAVAGVVAMIPFLGVLPQMWNMVVTTQFGRSRGASDRTIARIQELAGLNHPWEGHPNWGVLALAAIIAVIALAAIRSKTGRLALLVTAVCLAVLLTTPTWFRHYPELVAAPLVLSVGEGVGVLLAALPKRWLRAVVSVFLTASIALAGYVLLGEEVGGTFNGAKLAALAKQHPGCVTTDDPNSLIAADLISSNLARGCPFVIDLSGYRYYLGDRSTFTRNQAWQEFVATYLSNGSLNVMLRGTSADRIEPGFYSQLQSWPEVARINGRVVRAQP